MAVMGAAIGIRDEVAFASLIAPFVADAQRLAYGMLMSPTDCEDAVQEATFKAWRAHHRLRPNSDLRAWFLTIVANECRQRRRNRWSSILKFADLVTAQPRSVDFTDQALDLRDALTRLPYEMRLAIVLRYYLDLPLDEIGRVLKVSDKAAKARIHRGLRRLRVEIDGADDA